MQIKLSNIISDSSVGFVGNISDKESLVKFIQYFIFNETWLNKFNKIVLSINGSDESLANDCNKQLNNIYNQNKIQILYNKNIGPIFGAMHLDFILFEYFKQTNTKYVWKFSNDIISDMSIFDVIIDNNYDFFYINNIGYAAFNNVSKKQLFDNIKNQSYFYPQTNYYIYKNKITNWYPDYSEIIRLKTLYEEIKKKHPHYYPWDAIQGCDCESMLAKTIIDNNLKAYHLLSDNDTAKIIEAVYAYKIGDGSHKNIQYSNIGNLCHYHFMNQPILKI
jgi:hypothetical protein